jgi:hypothetical protein
MVKLLNIANPSEFIKNIHNSFNGDKPTSFIGLAFNNIAMTHGGFTSFDFSLDNTKSILSEEDKSNVEYAVVETMKKFLALSPHVEIVSILVSHPNLIAAHDIAQVVSDCTIYVDIVPAALIITDMNSWFDLFLHREGKYDGGIITSFELNNMVNNDSSSGGIDSMN